VDGVRLGLWDGLGVLAFGFRAKGLGPRALGLGVLGLGFSLGEAISGFSGLGV
jgi:hypothetical protein